MDKKLLLLVLIIVAISACTTYEPYEPTGGVVTIPNDSGISENDSMIGEEVLDVVSPDEEDVPETDIPQSGENVTEDLGDTEDMDVEGDVVAYEGELIDLSPMVDDPDGDIVELGFTDPFDDDGQWQTEVGDAGFYSIVVTATDNKGSFVTHRMTVRVLPVNEPPVIELGAQLEYDEGDVVELNPQITDPDGDDVTVTYSGWMTSSTYQTSFDDAGTHTVTITADDSTTKVSKDVLIIVNDVNKEPEVNIDNIKIEAVEGDLVEIDVSASDPEGDELTMSYSDPFDEDGEWQTEVGDEGSYIVDVVVSDGTNEVTNEVLVEIMKQNSPPNIDLISVSPEFVELKQPGDEVLVMIDVVASDPDDDELEVSYSGYMDTAEKTIEYGEPGGVKTVTVTVSDGQDSVSEDVSFEINNWPCFNC